MNATVATCVGGIPPLSLAIRPHHRCRPRDVPVSVAHLRHQARLVIARSAIYHSDGAINFYWARMDDHSDTQYIGTVTCKYHGDGVVAQDDRRCRVATVGTRVGAIAPPLLATRPRHGCRSDDVPVPVSTPTPAYAGVLPRAVRDHEKAREGVGGL